MPATLIAINNSLNYEFGKTAYSPVVPTTYYVGLSTTALTSSDTSGSVPTEPTGVQGYGRVPITNDKTRWSVSTAGSIVNLTSASFAQSTTAWGNIASVFLASTSASTTGEIWYYYNLSPVIPVMGATILTFSAGTITASRT